MHVCTSLDSTDFEVKEKATNTPALPVSNNAATSAPPPLPVSNNAATSSPPLEEEEGQQVIRPSFFFEE